MKNPNNTISLEEAAARRVLSKRRITLQVSEGGWGIQKVARDRYVLNEEETSYSGHRKKMKFQIKKDWNTRMLIEKDWI